MMNRRMVLVGGVFAFLAAAVAMPVSAAPAEEEIAFTNLDTLLKEKPLKRGGPLADIIASQHVDASDLQIVVAKKIELHTHEDSVHRIYVARGSGVFRFGGQKRPVKVGDILTVPKGVVHGFEAEGSALLVLLVVETPG